MFDFMSRRDDAFVAASLDPVQRAAVISQEEAIRKLFVGLGIAGVFLLAFALIASILGSLDASALGTPLLIVICSLHASGQAQNNLRLLKLAAAREGRVHTSLTRRDPAPA